MTGLVEHISIESEEEVLRRVMEQFLGRPMDLKEDAPKFTRAYRQGRYDVYAILFSGVSIGIVEKKFISPDQISITFTPTQPTNE